MLNIAILSRGAALYSTQHLYQAGIQRGHSVQIVDYQRCTIGVERQRLTIRQAGHPLPSYDVILPRIGVSHTEHGARLLRHFEMQGIHTLVPSEGLRNARDKFHCHQLLAAAGIPVPNTFMAGAPEDLPDLLDQFDDRPVVLKLVESTHGIGVLLAPDRFSALAMAETFSKLEQPILVQEFIPESGGCDIRAFVVGARVVAAIRRCAMPGEFRANLHRGATAEPVRLTREETKIALHSARTVGLPVAGVDLLRTSRGPLVVEVNASPGLQGIETATGINVSDAILTYLEKKLQSRTLLVAGAG
ncbi:MAG: hypothetical protein RLY31_3081 [Bacteroidota bacterium]|jgi:ribosomal protein S6--L-glutamate ligase